MPKLTPVQQKFILHWGEMGTRWGINRTVAQIHALLYLSPRPLPAEEIAATLEVARSNVSTSLRELQGWGIIRLVHVMGDKRDHFEALRDAWEMFRIIADERKRSEIDPTREVLRQCLAESAGDAYTRERMQAMSDFFETTAGWYDQVSKWPQTTLLRFFKLGDKALKLLGLGGG
ncbi:MAG TPA: MarR family transcriptional regulator [Candidatus Didemnitutus sp.]|nr:MarR family transcriptional regulator [Candidatus Didemnitutus sp.]